jgi:hypothetical protein
MTTPLPPMCLAHIPKASFLFQLLLPPLSCSLLLASLFSAATFHHLLLARGEGERRIKRRTEQERERESESELVTSPIVHVPARSLSRRVEASLSQQSECGKTPPSSSRLLSQSSCTVSGLQGGWRARFQFTLFLPNASAYFEKEFAQQQQQQKKSFESTHMFQTFELAILQSKLHPAH